MKILITGATGGIGRHLVRHLSTGHEVIELSRRPAEDSLFAPCDLVHEGPELRNAEDPSATREINWVIHLATTYRVEDDLAMLGHLVQFAKESEIPNFLYVSSWVVHFPRRPIKASYIEMKRRCEQRLLESGIENPRIVRPSVVTGPDLSWTKILKKLSVWAPLIPPSFSRSFITIEDVCRCVDKIIEGQTQAVAITCLGTRMSLADRSRQERAGSAAPWLGLITMLALGMLAALAIFVPSSRVPVSIFLGACVLGFVLIRYVLPKILGSVSDYMAGFLVKSFEPENEMDLIALCDGDNDIHVRGYDNAKLYFQSPHSPNHTTVCLRRFNQVLSVDPDERVVEVQAGAHFATLLPLLEAQGMWLENYPNYHYISVGASIATPVHGSNLEKAFLADLVESIRYYNRENNQIEMVSREDESFRDLLFEPDRRHVILSAQLRICSRQYYQLTSEQRPVASLTFEEQGNLTTASDHYEVRINSPTSEMAIIQSYRQVSPDDAEAVANEAKLMKVKADAIGRKWNWLQQNFVFSKLTSMASLLFINFEWFLPPEEFARFWQDIANDRSRYRFYKLLVRHNPTQPDVETPYHGTTSIDVTIFNTRKMLDLAGELFRTYHPREHLGKYSIAGYLGRQKTQSE